MSAEDANMPLRCSVEAALRGLAQAVWGLKITGLELVPPTGPLLVASTHATIAVPPVLAVAISPRRRPAFLGKKELFDVPVLGWFFRQTGSIPLDRRGDVAAMREALAVLARGGSVMIMPEGTRVPAGQARPAKPGVGFLAARAGAPTVPARVVGADHFPGAFPLEVRFGAPLPAPASDDRETALAYAAAVMEAVRAL